MSDQPNTTNPFSPAEASPSDRVAGNQTVAGLVARQSADAERMNEMQAELYQWRTWGVIEIMIRNPSVMEFARDKEAEIERLRRLLGRGVTILDNMAKENKPAIAFGWKRWPVHHEPLRADAKNLLAELRISLSGGSNG